MAGNSADRFEIDFRSNWRWIGIFLAAIATLILVSAAIERFSGPPGRSDLKAIISLIIAILAALIIRRIFFKSDIRWIVQSDGVRVERSWVYGRKRAEFINAAEIIEVMLFEDQVDDGYSAALLLRLAGRNIESPSLGDARRAHELHAAIARRLGKPLQKADFWKPL